MKKPIIEALRRKQADVLKNSSDSIRFSAQWFDEREKTMHFFEELERRSAEARQHPEKWVRLENL